MKTHISILLLLLVGCGSANIVYEGRDGTTLERAVVIRGASSTREGISAENAWIRQKFPGARKTGQALYLPNGIPCDEISIETVEGVADTIYFDVSDFFGKF